MKLKLIIYLIIAGILLYFVSRHLEHGGLSVGTPAPGWVLKDEGGAAVSSDAFRGRFVLLNFWATWCPTCRSEIPALNRLHERMKDRGLAVIGASIDEGGWPVIRSFRSRVPIQFPVLWDEGGKVADLYHVHRLPVTYLIDREGKILERFDGPQEWEKATLPAGDPLFD